jgi:Phage integrase, N-terminal SAM-like domain
MGGSRDPPKLSRPRFLQRNRYEVRARATDPKTGKRKDVKRIWNGSIQGALDLQRQLHDELKGAAIKQERVTLGAFARSWLERAVVRMRPSSARAYASRLNRILGMLGDHYIDALRPADIEAFQSKRIADGAAGRTIRFEIKVLRQLSRDAQLHEVIDRDFCLGVKVWVKMSEYTEDEPNCLSAEELTRLAAIIPDYWYALFAIMAFTDMRWGEASGLPLGRHRPCGRCHHHPPDELPRLGGRPQDAQESPPGSDGARRLRAPASAPSAHGGARSPGPANRMGILHAQGSALSLVTDQHGLAASSIGRRSARRRPLCSACSAPS